MVRLFDIQFLLFLGCVHPAVFLLVSACFLHAGWLHQRINYFWANQPSIAISHYLFVVFNIL